MNQSEYIKEIEEKIQRFEVKIRHLENELHLTKEEHEETTKRYFEIFSHMEKIISKRTQKLRESEEKYRISEHELRSIVNHAPDLIFKLDPDGVITFINHAINDYGYTSTELLGKKILELVHPEDQEKSAGRVTERRTGGRRTKLLELRLMTKERTPIHFESKSKHFGNFVIEAEGIYSSKKPIADKFVGTIVIARDMSERKRTEALFRQAQKLDAIGMLAGGLAHDFNNLLSIIMGSIELAKDDIGSADDASFVLENAEKALLRARELTHKLITFSTGGTPVKKPGSIEKLIKEAATFALSGTLMECDFYLSQDLWAVEFDPEQIKHAFRSMIINAAEAMPEGGRIDIRLENEIFDLNHVESAVLIPGGQYVKISITDHGVGIPEENMSKIFDPYFSTKETGTQKGLGLGLATTYSIIQKHNGDIIVRSEKGAGTTFSIYLPAYQKEIDEIKIEARPTTKPSSGRGRKILLMDDEEMLRNVGRELLRRLGYQVEVAGDGAKAVELYNQAMAAGYPFDMVMLDLTIKGGMGGKEALDRLLQIDPQVKAIVCSGYSNDPIISNFKKYGFVGALSKPYSVAELREMLHEL